MDVKSGKIQSTAAKREFNFKIGECEHSRIDEVKDVVLTGTRRLQECPDFDTWKAQMLREFPQGADERQAETLLQQVYSLAENSAKAHLLS